MAVEICRLAAAHFPESGGVQLALVRSLYSLHQEGEAIAGLEAFVNAHPQQAPEYDSWLGLLYDRTGRWSEGEPWHRKAVAIAPAVDYLHNNLGYNLLMQKKSADAAAEFREALRFDPASELARNNLGLALANENQGAQAVANWQTGADPATAHSNLAAVLIEQGNYPAARKELETALSYNKAHPAALKNMELLSRLDGKVATLPSANPSASLWERWKAGFIHLWWDRWIRRRSWPGPVHRTSQRGTMKESISRFIRDEQGQDLVEYALIVAAVGLALITTVNQLQQAIVSLYQSITGDL